MVLYMTMHAERSRTVMNVEYRGYNRKGVNYDWKAKVDQYLPHHGLPIVASVLFEPLPDECSIEATSARSMAWFSAAVSSGAPLVFVNIQSEQIVAKVVLLFFLSRTFTLCSDGFRQEK